MTARPWQDALTELVSTGLTQHQLVLLLEIVSAMSTGHSADIPPDTADILEKRRAYDRERKRKKRNQAKGLAKANDVASTAGPPATASTGLSTGQAENRCNLSSSDSQFRQRGKPEEEHRAELVEGRERKKVSRGTRLSADAQISDDDFQFALGEGMAADQVRRAWAEFVDYWIAIPGLRGTKLNWSSTWRNRVRQLSGRASRPPGRPSQPSFRQIAEQLRSTDEAARTDPADGARTGHDEFGPGPTLF